MAAIANVSFIDNQITKIVKGIIASMAVLPNRFLIKLDAKNDWFNTYQFPLGVLRLTVESASNLGADKKSKGFLGKLVHDEADTFVSVTLGETWRTKTINNNRHPEFNETHHFPVHDHDQTIEIDVKDDDTTSDDDIGIANTSIKELLLSGGVHEFNLTHNGEPTDGKVRVRAQFLNLVADPRSLDNQEPGTHGFLTVLIASVLNISGDRTQLKPSVAVKWGESKFRTAVKSDTPGADIQNPAYDVAYTVPLEGGAVRSGPPVRLALMDGEKERGVVEVPLQNVLSAPGLALVQNFQLQGDGAVIRAAIVLRGTRLAQ